VCTATLSFVHELEFVSRRSSITRCRLSDIVKRRSFRSVCTVMSCVRRHPMARLTARLSRIDLEASWSFCQCSQRTSFLSRAGFPSQDGRPSLDGLPSNERVFVRITAEVSGH